MRFKLRFRDLRWILLSSPALGYLLSFFSPGARLIGWGFYTLLLVAGLSALFLAWRWAGSSRTLAWMVALAFLLRVGGGIATSQLLPRAGYDSEPTQRAGYVFYDAFRRDIQAWDLARSDQPIWTAFGKGLSTDQYGGLLALSALVYRYLSFGAMRPLMMVVIGAVFAALGVIFLHKAARLAWGEKTADLAGWIAALYPESILLGSSQMREPFLISFSAMALFGLVALQVTRNRWGWLWLAAGLAGMLMFSPGIAVATLLLFGGWLWFSRGHHPTSWRVLVAAGVVLGIALVLFTWGAAREVTLGENRRLNVLWDWFQRAVQWDTRQLERSSGWVQKILEQVGEEWRLPFVIGYGLAQPVLPATLIEPTVAVWRVIGILRAVGWYALAPFLLYGLYAAHKTSGEEKGELWQWIGLAIWTWVIISAARAGGDQWDNPRYRTILLVWEALFAAHAWQVWRERGDAWLPRLLAVEGIFVALFTAWYISRYDSHPMTLPFMETVLAIIALALLVLVGGILWDRRRGRRRA